MRGRQLGPLLTAAALGLGLLTAGVEVLAEEVECPRCWRMIDEGPCRCPHCEARLPGRTCPPGEDEPEAAADEPEAAADEPEAAADEPEAAADDADRADDDARPPPRRRPDSRPERRRVRRRRPPPRERAEDRRRPPEERRRRRRSRDEPPERPRQERDDRSRQERSAASDEPEERGFAGPAFLIGYRYFGLQDWTGEGHTHALSIEGFPLRSIAPWFRLGLGLDTGFRLLERHTDWTMRGFLSLGVQYPWRVTPYGSLSVGGGMAYRKRFGQGMTDGLFGLGLDVGATFNITRTFVADIGLGYMYTSFDDLDYHGFTVRVALGW